MITGARISRKMRAAAGAAAAFASLALAPSAFAAPDDLVVRAAERDAAAALTAASGSRGRLRLPLFDRDLAPGMRARVSPRLMQSAAPARLLVGLRRHEDAAGVRALLEREGGDVELLASIGVLAFTADSAASATARLRTDPRVAFVERSRKRSPLFDPATDEIDPATGIPFDWAFGRVGAPAALAEVGGGSDLAIAIVDTGVDAGHPDLEGRIVRQRNIVTGAKDATDVQGHGTFVAGTIGMVHDNGIGGRGVGGRTPIMALKTDNPGGGFDPDDIVKAIEFAIRARARIVNLSLGGEELSRAEARVIDLAFFEDVLPVAATGNEAQEGNPVSYPAAIVGGEKGEPDVGLAVAATGPDDAPAAFSSHGDYVSLAAPGGGYPDPDRCWHGVFSTIPRGTPIESNPEECVQRFGDDEGGWEYGVGTSYAAPIAAGVSALAWQAEPRLQSQQVAEVMMRSARQTFGPLGTWNEFTGRGLIDGPSAVRLARVYDVLEPAGLVTTQSRKGRNKLVVRARGGVDRTDEGDELAGGVSHVILRAVNGGDPEAVGVGAARVDRSFVLRKGRRYQFIGGACDANGNCAIKRLSSVRGR